MKFYRNVLVMGMIVSASLSYTENNIISVESKQAFNQLFLNASQPLVILFHSGCPVCSVTRGHFTNITSKYPTAVTYVEVNVNKLSELTQVYGITSLPTLLIFQSGNTEPVHKLVAPDEKELASKINEILKLNEK